MSVRTSMGGIQIGNRERELSPGSHVKALNAEPGGDMGPGRCLPGM